MNSLDIISKQLTQMPNWCYNSLTIEGRQQDLIRFLEQNKSLKDQDEKLSFKRSVPCYDMYQSHEYRNPIKLEHNNANPLNPGFSYSKTLLETKLPECVVEIITQMIPPLHYDEDKPSIPSSFIAIKEHSKNWHSRHVEKWGTKWDACDITYSLDPELLEYKFLTAWSPPKPWLESVSQKYPMLQFTLLASEPGCGFSICMQIFVQDNIDEYECGDYGEFHGSSFTDDDDSY